MNGWKQEEASDDCVVAAQANPSSKLFQKAGDGARGAGRWRLESHGGAIGC